MRVPQFDGKFEIVQTTEMHFCYTVLNSGYPGMSTCVWSVNTVSAQYFRSIYAQSMLFKIHRQELHRALPSARLRNYWICFLSFLFEANKENKAKLGTDQSSSAQTKMERLNFGWVLFSFLLPFGVAANKSFVLSDSTNSVLIWTVLIWMDWKPKPNFKEESLSYKDYSAKITLHTK